MECTLTVVGHSSRILVAAIATILAAPAMGQHAVNDPTSLDGSFDGRTLGFRFTVTESVTVTALGALDTYLHPDCAECRCASGAPVGLYGPDGMLMVSVTIGPTGGRQGEYRYRDIEPTTLEPGQVYAVLAVSTFGSEYCFAFGATPTYDPRVVFVGMESESSGATLPPTLPGNPQQWSNQYYAANFLMGGSPAPCNAADINGDGAVDGEDLAILLGAWGDCD